MVSSQSSTIQPIPRIKALIGPFQKFVGKIATGRFLLFSATIIAVVWANISYESYHAVWHADQSIYIVCLNDK